MVAGSMTNPQAAGWPTRERRWIAAVVMAAALAIGTVTLEFFLSFALWFPRLRLAGMFGGAVLHVLVPVLLGPYAGLVVFSAATLSLYVLYLDRADLDYLRSRFPRLAPLVAA